MTTSPAQRHPRRWPIARAVRRVTRRGRACVNPQPSSWRTGNQEEHRTLADQDRTHHRPIRMLEGLKFPTDVSVPFTTNEADGARGPAKFQQRTSGGPGAPCKASPTSPRPLLPRHRHRRSPCPSPDRAEQTYIRSRPPRRDAHLPLAAHPLLCPVLTGAPCDRRNPQHRTSGHRISNRSWLTSRTRPQGGRVGLEPGSQGITTPQDRSLGVVPTGGGTDRRSSDHIRGTIQNQFVDS